MSNNKPPIPIKPINFDEAERVVKELSAERNVPSLVYPHQPRTTEPRQGRGEAPAPKPDRSPSRKFTVELPEYVIDAINERTIRSKPRKTSRYVILEALKALGFEIRENDMVLDGRRSEYR